MPRLLLKAVCANVKKTEINIKDKGLIGNSLVIYRF